VEEADGDPRMSESDLTKLAGCVEEYEDPRRSSMPLSPPPESRPPLGVEGRGNPRESV
jgi:hypothetical protein